MCDLHQQSKSHGQYCLVVMNEFRSWKAFVFGWEKPPSDFVQLGGVRCSFIIKEKPSTIKE